MDIVNKKFHFIAIGGVGMSALAKYLAQRGAVVSGSDIQDSKYIHLLGDLGIKISIGHDANLIEKDMIVVASSAIKSSNPEVIRAKELGLKIYHRSDILKIISDEFSKNPNGIFFGFSGTHGKTTTSGLCSYVLARAG
ncbi:UDP-N-acetylmuramate--L-alanine ligase, partial [bacterium]|nr:UDP-N-acetylmuramate--L-alanine ligase [bacterium]